MNKKASLKSKFQLYYFLIISLLILSACTKSNLNTDSTLISESTTVTSTSNSTETSQYYNVVSDEITDIISFSEFINSSYDNGTEISVSIQEEDEKNLLFRISDIEPSNNSSVFFQMNNGNYATYIPTNGTFEGGILFQYMDNTTIHQLIQIALNSDCTSIILPAGTFNMNNIPITLPYEVAIKGKSPDSCILQNVNIVAHYGLSLENLTLDRGTYCTISEEYISGDKRKTYTLQGDIMIIATPSGATKISYKNCIFKNTDYCSVALTFDHGSNYFVHDEAINCQFENIKKDAILHQTDSNQGFYDGNYFCNIGDSATLSGHISAIQLGDTSNATDVKYANAIISNNTIDNIIASYDYRDIGQSNYTFHLKCTGIDVHSNEVTISDNVIKNVIGYGIGRYAIYCKSNISHIINNVIDNIEADGGYITCKSGINNDFNSTYSEIIGNKITGKYGCGIKMHTTGNIANNKISLSNCKQAITISGASVSESSKSILISKNIINCTFSTKEIAGTLCPDYENASLILLSNVHALIEISDNELSLEVNDTSAKSSNMIYCNQFSNDVSISGNKIYSPHNIEYRGINLRSKDELSSNSKISISNNSITADKAISVIFSASEGTKSARSCILANNNLYVINPTGNNSKIIEWTTADSNKDSLTYSPGIIPETVTKQWAEINVNTLISEKYDYVRGTHNLKK